MATSSVVIGGALIVTAAAVAFVVGRSTRTAEGATAVKSAAAPAPAPAQSDLPPGANDALQRLTASPRHGEWVTVKSGADTIRAWVVYPERSDNAPVVVVVHEIFGMSAWVRAVADQVAADGFIAIAPDLLTMKDVARDANGDTDPNAARAVIGQLQRADIDRHIKAVADYAMALPAAKKVYGIVGFCWGGTTSFAHAVAAASLGASVVYYGTSPTTESLAAVRAPVLGLYGGADQRVDATIPPAEAELKRLGRTYEPHIFEGAGHGFLRAQDGNDGANMKATQQAWPLTVAWFRKYLGA
jgi:carboxymethylenebutenolidase